MEGVQTGGHPLISAGGLEPHPWLRRWTIPATASTCHFTTERGEPLGPRLDLGWTGTAPRAWGSGLPQGLGGGGEGPGAADGLG